jgi:tetratricopeptide (TPR) repeat protein
MLYEESLETFREFGDRWGTALALADLGNLARERADFPQARALYKESLQIFRDLDFKRGVAQILESFAMCSADQKDARRALELAGAAAALRHSAGVPLPAADQEKLESSLASARQTLDGSDAAEAWVAGWGMPLESAIGAAISPDAV